MNNTLGDLNNQLFAQLNRLNDANLKGEDMQKEIERAKAVVGVSNQIVQNGNLMLKAQQFVADTHGRSKTEVPKVLIGEANGQKTT